MRSQKWSHDTKMRIGDWELQVSVNNSAIVEHTLDGHPCIASVADAEFEIHVRYHGAGHFMFKVFVDDKDVSGCWHKMDADCVSTSTRRRHGSVGRVAHTFKGWEKTADGQTAVRSFVFAKVAADGDGEGDFSRPIVGDWTRGHITLAVYDAELYTVTSTQCLSAKADQGPVMSLDEATMVKNGLSTTAGAGAVSFRRSRQKRVGEVSIRVPRAPEARRKVAELRLFYRDSFFMLLREDSCCGGACARQRAADEARPTRATELRTLAGAGAGSSGAPIRERLVGFTETRERIARKRPAAGEAPIDLTVSDDEAGGEQQQGLERVPLADAFAVAAGTSSVPIPVD